MDICTSFINLLPDLRSIPAVVWSGVVASVITLSGVIASNGSNTNRLILQLKHDSKEKEKERKAKLRSEIYLKASEELTKANSYLASLPQADLSKVNPADGLKEFFANAAKLQVVAEVKTCNLVGEVVAAYGALMMKCIVLIQPVQKIKASIDAINGVIDHNQTEMQRTVAEMVQHNEVGQGNQDRFSALQRSFGFAQQQSEKLCEERDALWRQYHDLHAQFSLSLLAEVKEIAKLQVPALVAIRHELELEGNDEEFLAQITRQQERAEKSLVETLNQLQAAQKQSALAQ